MYCADDKKKIIDDVIKNSKISDENENIKELVKIELLNKSSFIFEVAGSQNEIFDFLYSILDKTAKKVKDNLKGFSKTDFMKETDPLNTIKDPIEFQYDITYEEKYLRNLLDKLQLLSSLKPDTDYISIFYERYIEKLSCDEICKNHKLTELQLNEKILEMVRFINKDN